MNSTHFLFAIGGMFLGAICMIVVQSARINPFEISDLDRYDDESGDGPLTLVGGESEWITWNGQEKLPVGVNLCTKVLVRYSNGAMSSEPMRAGALYWRRMVGPAEWDIAAYKVVA